MKRLTGFVAAAGIFAAVSGTAAQSPAPEPIDPAVAENMDLVEITQQIFLEDDEIPTEILLGDAFRKSRCAAEEDLQAAVSGAWALYKGGRIDNELEVVCFWGKRGELLPVALKPVPLTSWKSPSAYPV